MSNASILIVLPTILTVAAPLSVKLMAPDVALPPGAFNVVTVLLSTTCPEILITSPVLSMNRDTALDPDGTLDGTATARVMSSSTPAPELPPEVNLIIFSEALTASTADTE